MQSNRAALGCNKYEIYNVINPKQLTNVLLPTALSLQSISIYYPHYINTNHLIERQTHQMHQ